MIAYWIGTFIDPIDIALNQSKNYRHNQKQKLIFYACQEEIKDKLYRRFYTVLDNFFLL